MEILLSQSPGAGIIDMSHHALLKKNFLNCYCGNIQRCNPSSCRYCWCTLALAWTLHWLRKTITVKFMGWLLKYSNWFGSIYALFSNITIKKYEVRVHFSFTTCTIFLLHRLGCSMFISIKLIFS